MMKSVDPDEPPHLDLCCFHIRMTVFVFGISSERKEVFS